ncbi:uncharacterized protein TM35_000141170 [Trypanosoma theileri]|uniref:Uncharacterized protein n=1 Tax=Trypanosoma theileri TaxID=67003 RepID=A0A1X0NW23_9TRYP|nr:uncharacterized protein TM35_000141170 [Trypanosoma theileri]ORC88906.1 hypothetical protein TM35_000141170 [Trypanosoma theileri]
MSLVLRTLFSATRPLRQQAQSAAPHTAEWMLRGVAAKIPPAGVTGAQLQAMLEDEAPHFQPSAVGALSLKDAIQSFPNMFIVETDNTGKWIVKSVGNARSSSEIDKSGALGIVDFCRSNSLVVPQGAYTSLLVAMQKTGIKDKGILRELLMSDEISRVLQVKLSLGLKPKRQPSNAYCFIDGDEIGTNAVQQMWKELNLTQESTRFVARRPTSVKHSGSDIIAPDDMPTYAILELKARELALRQSVVLQDIIYMCSSKQFAVYAEHVAKLNTFPDSDVYVCCPSKIRLVSKKQYVPL